jgi:hypothetical protein
VLPFALNLQAGIHLIAGDFAAAEAMGDEAHAVSDAIANPGVPYLRLNLAGHRGQQEETSRLTAAGERDARSPRSWLLARAPSTTTFARRSASSR